MRNRRNSTSCVDPARSRSPDQTSRKFEFLIRYFGRRNRTFSAHDGHQAFLTGGFLIAKNHFFLFFCFFGILFFWFFEEQLSISQHHYKTRENLAKFQQIHSAPNPPEYLAVNILCPLLSTPRVVYYRMGT